MSKNNPRNEPIDTPVIMRAGKDSQHLITLSDQESPEIEIPTKENGLECNLYAPGHHVHFIQLKLGIDKPLRPATLLRAEGQAIIVEIDGAEHTWFNHRPENLQALIDAYGGPVPGWEHSQHMFECQGHIFCMAMDHGFKQCEKTAPLGPLISRAMRAQPKN